MRAPFADTIEKTCRYCRRRECQATTGRRGKDRDDLLPITVIETNLSEMLKEIFSLIPNVTLCTINEKVVLVFVELFKFIRRERRKEET